MDHIKNLIKSRKVYPSNKGWIKVEKSFLYDDSLSGSEKIILLTLRTYNHEKDHICFPSIKKLSEVSKMSPRHIIRCLKILEEKRYINIMKMVSNKGQINVYKILKV